MDKKELERDVAQIEAKAWNGHISYQAYRAMYLELVEKYKTLASAFKNDPGAVEATQNTNNIISVNPRKRTFRYPMWKKDRSMQLTCERHQCIFKIDCGGCKNVSPAVIIHANGYVKCQTFKMKEKG